MKNRDFFLSAIVILISGCSNLGDVHVIQCQLTGSAVGKAKVRFPVDFTGKKIFWSTASGVADAKPVHVLEWTDKLITGSFKIIDSYALAINLANDTATLDSVSLFNGAKTSSSGPCERVPSTDAEKSLVAGTAGAAS